MNTSRLIPLPLVIFLTLPSAVAPSANADSAAPAKPQLEPQPILSGDQVVTLYPPGHPALKQLAGADQPEKIYRAGDKPTGQITHIENIHNPSIEVQLPPTDKANGAAVIVAPGGANTTVWVGPEGVGVGRWLNEIGVASFTLRYRLKPYDSAVDALADTQRAIRTIRARAKEWNVDPKKVGVMGFSAGGEQAARVALKFDSGDASARDPIDKESCRPDFVVLVYAGWKEGSVDLSSVPKDAPPAFCVCAGVDDAFHAKETVDFYNAYFNAKLPVELHIYGHGGHGGGISARNGIPFGAWPERFVEWAQDISMLPKPKSTK